MSTDPIPTVATSYFGQIPTWALLMILIMYTIAVVWLTVKIVKMLNDSRWHWVLGKFVWPTKNPHTYCGPMITLTPTAYRQMKPGCLREPEVYHYMPECQDSDYSSQNYILRSCKRCNAAYSKRDLGRLGMDVNLINIEKALRTKVQPCFEISEDLILPTGPAIQLSTLTAEAEGVPTQPGVLDVFPPPVAHNVTSLRSQQRAQDTTTRLRNRMHLLDEEYYNSLDPNLDGQGSQEPHRVYDDNSPTNTTTTADWDHVM